MAGASQSQSVSHSVSSSDTYIPEYSQTPILNEIATHARAMSDQVYNWGMEQFNKAQGDIDSVMRDALSYASPQRIAVDMGMAEAGVQQAGERGRLSAERDLQSYGIDPSSGRYAQLNDASRVMTAAAAAGAGNQQRMADQAAGNAMRQQAISAGLQNNQFGLGVGNSANAFLQTGMQLKYPPLGRKSDSVSDSNSKSASVQTDPPQQAKGGGGEKQPGGEKGGGGGDKGGGGGQRQPAGAREPSERAQKPVAAPPQKGPPPQKPGKAPKSGEEPVGTADPYEYYDTVPYLDDQGNLLPQWGMDTFEQGKAAGPDTPQWDEAEPVQNWALSPNDLGQFNMDPASIPGEVPGGQPYVLPYGQSDPFAAPGDENAPTWDNAPAGPTYGTPAETPVAYDPYAGNTQQAAFQDPNIDPITGQPIDNDEGGTQTTDMAGSLYGLEPGGWTEAGQVQPAGYEQAADQDAMWSDIGQGTLAEPPDGGTYDSTYDTWTNPNQDPGTYDTPTDDYIPGPYDFTGPNEDPGAEDPNNYDFGDQDYGGGQDYQDDYADWSDQDYYDNFEGDYGTDDSYADAGDNSYDDYTDDSYDDSYDASADDAGDDSYDDYTDDNYDDGGGYDDSDDYDDSGDYDDGGDYARGGPVRRRRPMRPRRPRPPTGYRPRPPMRRPPPRPPMRNGQLHFASGGRIPPPPVPGARLAPPPPKPQQAPRPQRGAPMAAPGGPRPTPMGRGPRPMPGDMISGNGMPAPTGMPQRMAGGGGVGSRGPNPENATSGGFVSRELSPSGGSKVDDVEARLNADEFVIPKDVAMWKGKEFFYKMIAQARKNRSAPNGGTDKPQTGYGSRPPGRGSR